MAKKEHVQLFVPLTKEESSYIGKYKGAFGKEFDVIKYNDTKRDFLAWGGSKAFGNRLFTEVKVEDLKKQLEAKLIERI